MDSVDETTEDPFGNWQEFISNTTFHGVRYIFLKTSFMRRLFWVICVFASLSLFCLQVVERSKTYILYDSNVNLELSYETEVKFPAVTLCNLNTFRMTKVDELGMYSVVDAVFGSKRHLWNDTKLYDSSYTNLTDFYLKTAHDRSDLIQRCFWNGHACNVTSDFDPVFTDVGLCYVFNGGKNTRTVNESGSAYGLSLIVNIEQYEYMSGYHNDAGVKLLLHDHKEVPLMKDMAFTIAPGTHALVGIKQTQVKSLEHPWGSCNFSSEVMSHCRLRCKTDHVVEQCGCRDVYMASKSDVCNVSMALTCVRKQT